MESKQKGVFFKWLTYKDRRVLYLSGPAGSGKTTWLNMELRQLQDSVLPGWELVHYDFDDCPEDIQAGFNTTTLANDTARLLVLDDIYSQAGLGELIEKLLINHPGELKIALASRQKPSGIWLVSPLLRKTTMHHRFFNDYRFNGSPDVVLQRYLREADTPAIFPYLQTAATAWRFDRDLLSCLHGGIKAMTFQRIQQFSFVYRDQVGFYLDPVLKNAILKAMEPGTKEDIRNHIYCYSQGEGSGPGGGPIHWLNTLYTVEDDVYAQIFNASPPGAIVQTTNLSPVVNNWSRVIGQETTLEALPPDSDALGVFLEGELQALAVLCSVVTTAAKGEMPVNETRSLSYLVYQPAQEWAISCLMRYLLVNSLMKWDILTEESGPEMEKILASLGAVPLKDTKRFLIKLHNLSLTDWADQLQRGRIRHFPRSDDIVNSTRKTLEQWGQTGQLRDSPLWQMMECYMGVSIHTTGDVFSRFERAVARELQLHHTRNPRMARIIKIIYLHRSTTLRELSRELGIPERTLYRQIHNSLYEIGRNILDLKE